MVRLKNTGSDWRECGCGEGWEVRVKSCSQKQYKIISIHGLAKIPTHRI